MGNLKLLIHDWMDSGSPDPRTGREIDKREDINNNNIQTYFNSPLFRLLAKLIVDQTSWTIYK